MVAKYEYYDSGDDNDYDIYSNMWRGQTFTPSTSHVCVKLKLKIKKYGSPSGYFTVSLRATSGGLPTGDDLASATIEASELSSEAAWVEFVLSQGVLLTASTAYAIVVRFPDGDISNNVIWRSDNTSPTYSGGGVVYSANSGESWNLYSYDFMFEEYGLVPVSQSVIVG